MTVFTHTIISPIHLSLKPIFLMTFSRYPHSTRSYALLMSSLIAMYLVFPEIIFFILFRDSNATSMLSEISLFLTKADWCSVMMVGKIFLSLFARTLEKILYRTLPSNYFNVKMHFTPSKSLGLLLNQLFKYENL